MGTGFQAGILHPQLPDPSSVTGPRRAIVRLTRHGEYAIRATLYLASLPAGKLASITEIASKEHIPRNFLAKILKDLQRAGILKSFPGAAGGYRLARDTGSITFRMIIEAGQGAGDDGDDDNGHADARPMTLSIFSRWSEANEAFNRILENTRLSDLPPWIPPSGGDEAKH